jgi:general secretion pathway protein J
MRQRQRHPLHRAGRGFTLVEVLVALMIMAVLSTMAWQGIDGIVRARDISQAQLDRSLRLNTVMSQWDQDLAALFDTNAVPNLSFDGSNLRLVRRADAGVQLVAWSRRGEQWLRWAGPVVTRVAELQQSWLRSQQLLGDEGGQLVLLEGVTDLRIEFFRNNGWSNPQSSGDVAPAAPGSGAPQREASLTGVRLVLAFGEQRLTRDVALALQQP